jgi:hypothetical protein
LVGLAGQALAVASVYPHELSYFNRLVGGPAGGKFILADSNLDWGQGLNQLARIQHADRRFNDLTLYYFGDTDPAHYQVLGRSYVIDAGDSHPELPLALRADTEFLAVSTSLQYGPWGPPGYFQALVGLKPVAVIPDQTIAIYRVGHLVSKTTTR